MLKVIVVFRCWVNLLLGAWWFMISYVFIFSAVLTFVILLLITVLSVWPFRFMLVLMMILLIWILIFSVTRLLGLKLWSLSLLKLVMSILHNSLGFIWVLVVVNFIWIILNNWRTSCFEKLLVVSISFLVLLESVSLWLKKEVRIKLIDDLPFEVVGGCGGCKFTHVVRLASEDVSTRLFVSEFEDQHSLVEVFGITDVASFFPSLLAWLNEFS